MFRTDGRKAKKLAFNGSTYQRHFRYVSLGLLVKVSYNLYYKTNNILRGELSFLEMSWNFTD